MNTMKMFTMAACLCISALGAGAQEGYVAEVHPAQAEATEAIAAQDEHKAAAEDATKGDADGIAVMRLYVSEFPHAKRRKHRFNREIVLEDAEGGRAIIFRRDSLIIGPSVFKLERRGGTRYLVNQLDRDTVGSVDRRWRTLTVEGYGTLTRERGRDLGYNLIYSDAQGVEVARVRHARFEGVNKVWLHSQDQAITPLLMLSALASLREVEKEERGQIVSSYATAFAVLILAFGI